MLHIITFHGRIMPCLAELLFCELEGVGDNIPWPGQLALRG